MGAKAAKIDLEKFKRLQTLVHSGDLTALEVCKLLNISSYLYYKWVNSVDEMIEKDKIKVGVSDEIKN